MHKKLISSFLLLFCLSLSAQDKTDSLKKFLTTSKDTTRVNTLNELGFEYCENDAKLSLQYGREALTLSQKLNFKIGQAKALNTIGIVYDVIGDYDSALYYYNSSLSVSKSIDSKKQIANTLNNIGLVEWNKGEYDKALKNYLSSLNIFESLGNKKGQANTLSNIGLIYFDLKKFTQSLEYHLQALKIREEIKDDYGVGVSLTNLGMTYSELKDNDRSLDYFKRSISAKEKSGDLYGLAISLNNIGIIYTETNKNDEALKYHLRALPIRIKLDDKYGLITTYNNIAGVYGKQNKFREALEYSMKALPLAEELKSGSKLRKVYRDISYGYKKLGQSDLALSYYEKYSLLNDSLYSEEGAKKLAELQTKYESEKKDLELSKKGVEIERSKLEITQQITQRNILLAAFLILSFIAFLLYNRYKLKQKNILQEERSQQQELRTKAIIEAEENERARIARELHDGIGQQLSAVKLNLSNMQSMAGKKDPQQAKILENILEIVDDSVKEVRSVSHSMMPNALLKSGLGTAVREFLNRINNSGKIKIELEVSGLNERLENTVENILFRVIQESVNNIIKHSRASVVNIQLIRYEDELSLMIQDNGVGFDPDKEVEGIGLKNIRSRIEFINGTVHFDSAQGKGTTITVEIPLPKNE
jgi:two-component system, NarL family, sensor kinase